MSFTMTMEIALGNEALAYVRERLASGHTLAKGLAELSKRIRKVYTVLPAGASREDLADFYQGGKLPGGSRLVEATSPLMPLPNTDTDLSRRLAAWLSVGKRICIFENALARKGDPVVERLPNVATCGDEVLHVISAGATEQDVLKVVRAAKSIPQFVGCVAEDDGWRFNDGAVDVNLLRRAAETAVVIIVGAYDGESYIMAEL